MQDLAARMSLQEVRNSILALRPSDWLKVADWIALTSFLTLFVSSGSAGRLGEASFFLAMALSTSAHAVCTTIHRRYLALHGRLPDPPLSRIGAASEILTYRASLQVPLIDLLLYLALFFLGFAATVFWFLSPLVLAPLYATTVIVDSRIVRTVAQTPGSRLTGKSWMVLITLQPASYLPLVIGNTFPVDPRFFVVVSATFMISQLGFLASLLRLHEPGNAPEQASAPRPRGPS